MDRCRSIYFFGVCQSRRSLGHGHQVRRIFQRLRNGLAVRSRIRLFDPAVRLGNAAGILPAVPYPGKERHDTVDDPARILHAADFRARPVEPGGRLRLFRRLRQTDQLADLFQKRNPAAVYRRPVAHGLETAFQTAQPLRLDSRMEHDLFLRAAVVWDRIVQPAPPASDRLFAVPHRREHSVAVGRLRQRYADKTARPDSNANSTLPIRPGTTRCAGNTSTPGS